MGSKPSVATGARTAAAVPRVALPTGAGLRAAAYCVAARRGAMVDAVVDDAGCTASSDDETLSMELSPRLMRTRETHAPARRMCDAAEDGDGDDDASSEQSFDMHLGSPRRMLSPRASLAAMSLSKRQVHVPARRVSAVTHDDASSEQSFEFHLGSPRRMSVKSSWMGSPRKRLGPLLHMQKAVPFVAPVGAELSPLPPLTGGCAALTSPIHSFDTASLHSYVSEKPVPFVPYYVN
eukprot:TRINITY_DN14279_c0_g1_i1.p1 TRINITY_DN14279_c0_g1~~TRINITY_DN14279_c0_g1_i1.p1  ORF type:complete len:236 (+),score=60.65 TRINITY_DN14279_c0_g1_i1:78-785(+)